MPMDPQPNIIALLLLLAPTPVWWRVSQWLSSVLHEYPIFKKNTFIEPWKSTVTATLENCGSTLRDLVVLRDRSYRKFGGDTEVARGRGELPHWLSLPSPRGKKPPALHDSSSDPTAAPLKPEQPIRPCLPDRFGFPKDAEELNKLYRGDVWKRPHIRSLALLDREGVSFGFKRLFWWQKTLSMIPAFFPEFSLSHQICKHSCFLLLITDACSFFFYSQENLQSTLERKCWLSSSREQRSPSWLRSKRPDVRRALN